MNKKELWLKLRDYHFDHLVPTNLWEHIVANFGGHNAFSKAFASKIARKHGWKDNFTLRAVKEYKKFVYLGIVSDFIVTPSKIIDVVWHEHLLFSKGYREFCTDVIQYEFDHYPELIPFDEQTGIFKAQYLDTLKLYTKEFGFEPPDDVWEITKYNKETIAIERLPSKKKNTSTDSSGHYFSDMPLNNYFEDSTATNSTDFSGGDFDGGGAGGSWSDADGDDAGSDGSDGGSDGGGDGSSCSSGCGGGCGGGGD